MPVTMETYQLLQQLLAHTPDLVFFKDRHSRYLEFNEALLKLTGVPREVLLGSDTSSFLPRELTRQILQEDQEVMASKVPHRSEQWVEFADGRLALMDTIIAPILDKNGEAIGLLGIGRDITALMNTSLDLKEKIGTLEKANRELDVLLQHAAHDLRAPLASILGLIEVMREEQDPTRLKVLLDMQAEKVNRLDGFVQDLVNLSKNSREEVKREDVDLNQLFFRTVDQFRFLPNASRIHFDCAVSGFPTFQCDSLRLGMVMSNLISNAVRYHDPQKEVPFVRMVANVTAEKVVLRLEDNGVGIGKDHLEHIFKMFYRANKQNKGSGIGLYITKETLQKIGGTISVESQEGVGTTFTLELPNELEPS